MGVWRGVVWQYGLLCCGMSGARSSSSGRVGGQGSSAFVMMLLQLHHYFHPDSTQHFSLIRGFEQSVYHRESSTAITSDLVCTDQHHRALVDFGSQHQSAQYKGARLACRASSLRSIRPKSLWTWDCRNFSNFVQFARLLIEAVFGGLQPEREPLRTQDPALCS